MSAATLLSVSWLGTSKGLPVRTKVCLKSRPKRVFSPIRPVLGAGRPRPASMRNTGEFDALDASGSSAPLDANLLLSNWAQEYVNACAALQNTPGYRLYGTWKTLIDSLLKSPPVINQPLTVLAPSDTAVGEPSAKTGLVKAAQADFSKLAYFHVLRTAMDAKILKLKADNAKLSTFVAQQDMIKTGQALALLLGPQTQAPCAIRPKAKVIKENIYVGKLIVVHGVDTVLVPGSTACNARTDSELVDEAADTEQESDLGGSSIG